MSVCGCVVVTCPQIGTADAFSPAAGEDATAPHPSVNVLLSQHADIMDHLARFEVRHSAKRESVKEKFAGLRVTIDAVERAALSNFDEAVKATVKALQLHAEALYVKACQATAGVEVGVEEFRTPDDEVDVALTHCLVSEVLIGCWRLAHGSSADNVDHCLQRLDVVDYVSGVLWLCHIVQGRYFSFQVITLASESKSSLLAELKALELSIWGQSYRDSVASSAHAGWLPPAGETVITLYPEGPSHSTCMAVSRDGSKLVVGTNDQGSDVISVYDLPTCLLTASFGRIVPKAEGLHVDYPEAICFAPNGNLLIAEFINQRVQEVSLAGQHIRFIGSEYCDQLSGIDANDEVVVVTQCHRVDSQLAVFAFEDGALLRAFGVKGTDASELGACHAVALSPDGRHIVVAESDQHRMSVFTIAGEFVRRLGESPAVGLNSRLRWPHSVLWPRGDVILAVFSRGCTIAEYSAEDGKLVKQFGKFGMGEREFREPLALAIGAGSSLFVLEANVLKVHVMV